MRAAVFTEFSGPDGIDIREQPAPEPAADEVRIRVQACSLNRHDLKILTAGLGIGVSDPPFVSGVDVSGVVDGVGSDVESVVEGDRVVRCPNVACGRCRACREGPENRCERFSLAHGGLAEFVCAPADRSIVIPGSLPFSAAATLPVAYTTAYHMIRRAGIRPGDRVFVPGAAGSVGVAAVGLLSALGARSVATSSSAEKCERLEAIGADEVVQGDTADELRDAVLMEGPVDAVLDHLGGPFTQVGLDVLRRGGTLAICGQTAGDRPTIQLPTFYLEHHTIVGSTMGTQGDLETAVTLVASGDLDPPVGDEYPLEGTADAFRDLAARRSFGSLVIRP